MVLNECNNSRVQFHLSHSVFLYIQEFSLKIFSNLRLQTYLGGHHEIGSCRSRKRCCNWVFKLIGREASSAKPPDLTQDPKDFFFHSKI